MHGGIGRREFLAGAQKFATAAVTAAALVEMLRPNYAWAHPGAGGRQAASRPKTSPCLRRNGTGHIDCYLVRPATAPGKLPAVLVIHENRGLNPYIKDVARRLATAGYMAFAPDGLTSVGGYPGDDEKGARAVRASRSREDARGLACRRGRISRTAPDCTGKIGAVGFCFGGGVVNYLAVRMGSDLARRRALLRRAAQRRGRRQDQGADQCPVWRAGHAHQRRLARLRRGAEGQAGVPHEGHIYENANHGFHNDTTPRYDEAAAKEAWQRTLDWFENI